MARAFFRPAARRRVTEAIHAVEAQTSAEVVVAVRRAADAYRDVDCLVGFVFAMGALCALLFLDQEFDTDWMPFDVLVAFVFGALLSHALWPFKRLLLLRRYRQKKTRVLARAAFVDLGVARKSTRRGILVLVSLFERCVEIVPDIGVDPKALGAEWQTAVQALERAARRADVEAFTRALRAMGPALAAEYPHHDDDVDELSDELEAA